MNEISQILKATQSAMKDTISFLEEKLSKIRAGKANPKLLDDIRIMYYGNLTPLSNVANVVVPDAKTIIVTPWEKKILRDIEKAIMDSELGITPENNGEIIRITLPPLTEERRKQLAKQVKAESESAKVSIRNARRDANDRIKKAQEDGLSEDQVRDTEKEIQKIHDDFIKKVDEVYNVKEKEIMTV